jgi:hypothetical protein
VDAEQAQTEAASDCQLDHEGVLTRRTSADAGAGGNLYIASSATGRLARVS